MTPADTVIEDFLKAGLYLRNWSQQTADTYQRMLRHAPAKLTKESLEKWVMALRERGLSPGGVNVHIRSMNALLGWLREDNPNVPKPLKLLKTTLRVKTLLTAGDIKLLVNFKPRNRVEKRTQALMLTLLDTGVRIDEALSLKVRGIDIDGLTMKVLGKGSKERMVLISPALRGILYRVCKGRSPESLVFPTFKGQKLMRRNVYRDFSEMARRTGVRTHVHPHLLRHQFAANFIKQGGDVFRLSRLLGHTSVTTTQLYLRSLGVEDLRDRPVRSALEVA